MSSLKIKSLIAKLNDTSSALNQWKAVADTRGESMVFVMNMVRDVMSDIQSGLNDTDYKDLSEHMVIPDGSIELDTLSTVTMAATIRIMMNSLLYVVDSVLSDAKDTASLLRDVSAVSAPSRPQNDFEIPTDIREMLNSIAPPEEDQDSSDSESDTDSVVPDDTTPDAAADHHDTAVVLVSRPRELSKSIAF